MRVMILTPGINQDAQSWGSWPNQAAVIINRRQGWAAQPLEYESNALDVDAKQSERVATLADMLKAYAQPGPDAPSEIHAMAHSNGTRVDVSALPLAEGARLKTLHLLCGAVDADFGSNGLNAALRSGQVEHVYVYVATADSAMRIEDTAAGDLLFGIPLGHKPLGLAGPANVDPAMAGKVTVVEWQGYDHSTCWDDEHLAGTVDQVMAAAETP